MNDSDYSGRSGDGNASRSDRGCSASSAFSPESPAGWVELVERIKSGEPGYIDDLYQLFSKGVRFYLRRHLGQQDLDHQVHDAFALVVQAIRRGELREPERLPGFVRTIVRRQVAAHIDKAHTFREPVDLESSARVADPRENPGQSDILRQRVELIKRVLAEFTDRDREILTRFYLREQNQNQICAEMSITENQLRLLKSRANARIEQLCKESALGKLSRRFFENFCTPFH
jgi:RNA polymerase sigma-70 factor (ECF subfamily)